MYCSSVCKPAHRKSDRSHATSASKQSTTQQSETTHNTPRSWLPAEDSMLTHEIEARKMYVCIVCGVL